EVCTLQTTVIGNSSQSYSCLSSDPHLQCTLYFPNPYGTNAQCLLPSGTVQFSSLYDPTCNSFNSFATAHPHPLYAPTDPVTGIQGTTLLRSKVYQGD